MAELALVSWPRLAVAGTFLQEARWAKREAPGLHVPQPCPETRPWSGCVDLWHFWGLRGAGWPSASAPAPLLGWLLPERWAGRGRPRPAASTEPPLPPGQTRDRTGGSAPEDKGPLGFPSCQTQSQRVWDPGGAPHAWPRFQPFPRCLEENSRSRPLLRGPAPVPLVLQRPVKWSRPCRRRVPSRGPGLAGSLLGRPGAVCRPSEGSAELPRGPANRSFLRGAGTPAEARPAVRHGRQPPPGAGWWSPGGAWRAVLPHAWSQASATHLSHLVPGISCPPSSRAAGHHGHAASLAAYR